MAPELLILRCAAAGSEPAQGARERLAARQNALFVKRIAPIRIVAFLLLAACRAPCQSASQGAELQRSQLEGATAQDQLSALPDAPSQLALAQPDRLKTIANQARLPLATSAGAINADVLRATEATHLTPEAPLTVTALSKGGARQEKTDDFFSKYLSASRQQNSNHEPSSSGKVVARATDAASRIFLTRAPSGKPRFNTPYFMRVLTSVAAESASRRYRARSGTAPLSAFGSTVGNDAGMNLLHEFGPGIRQKVTGHLPEFVSRIGEHISRAQSRR